MSNLPPTSKIQNVVADDSLDDFEEIDDKSKYFETEGIGLGGLYSAQVELIKMKRQFYNNYSKMGSKLAKIEDAVNL